MKKIIFLITLFFILFSFLHNEVSAAPIIDECQIDVDCLPNGRCLRDTVGNLKCSFPAATSNAVQNTFGKIQPPEALKGLLKGDPTGAAGISKFLSNFVSLIYIAATIMLVFMLIWGAWDWMTSEGDKEKLQSAQRKIINAFIGILLFAVAFALLRVLGAFTGFTFFTG